MTRLKGGNSPAKRWLWLALLLIVLGIGGCYLLRGNGGPLDLNAPAEGASLSGPVTISGTGKAGETVTVSENGAAVTTAQVGQDGTFSASLPAPSAGSHTYSVSESGSQTALSRTVSVAATPSSGAETPPAATPSGTDSTATGTVSGADASSAGQTASGSDSAASGGTSPSGAQTTTSAAGTDPSAATQTPSATDQTPSSSGQTTPSASANGTLSIAAPASGTRVPAGALTLSGNGPANSSVSVTEDGSDLGQAQTDASGEWTFQVPSPKPGAHTYRVAAGGATQDLKLTVAAGGSQAGRCARPFSLSLRNGQRVRGPFRFGGVGSGQAYRVTVFRGDRQVGQKVLPLDSSCGWSYTSRPGKGRVTYTLQSQGQSAVAGKVTLNVTR